MTIGNAMMMIGSGMSLFIMMAYGLNDILKTNRRIVLLFASLGGYELLELIYILSNRETTVILEILFVWVMCVVFLKGNVWRNYFFVTICFFLINFIFFGVCSVNDTMADIYYKERQDIEITAMEGLLDSLVCCIAAIIVVMILRQFFKGKYRGNAILYKVFILFYVLINSLQLYAQEKVTEAVDGGEEFQPFLLAIFIVSSVILALAWIFTYDRFEKIRLEKEKEKLKSFIKNAYAGLQENSKEMGLLPRTGNIILDSVLSGHTSMFHEKDIIFETSIQPLEDRFYEDRNIIAIIDNLLGIANEMVEKSYDAFVKLSLRNMHGAIIIKLETAQPVIGKNGVFRRNRMVQKKFNLIKEIIEIQDSVIVFSADKDYEVSIVMVED